MAMRGELEEGDSSQYPLEDILDKYLVHVAEFLETDTEQEFRYIFGGELESLQKLKLLVGKRAFNEDFTDDEGTNICPTSHRIILPNKV